jgi:hypothetical protein
MGLLSPFENRTTYLLFLLVCQYFRISLVGENASGTSEVTSATSV